MASTWQIEANRRNAAKATGPKTASGKARSSRNAITHGANSTAVDDRSGDPAFDAERDNWVGTFAPRNHAAKELATTAFLNYKRFRRLHMAEEHAIARNVRTAADRFELDRRARVDAAEANLLVETFASYLFLTSNVVGVDRLTRVLDRVENALRFGIWTDECVRLLRAVHGFGSESEEKILEVASKYVVDHQTPITPEDLSNDLLDEMAGLSPETTAKPEPEPEPTDRDSLRLLQARLALQERIDDERAELALIRSELEGEHEYSRREAETLALVDFSPEGRLLSRYVQNASNAFYRTFQAAQGATPANLKTVEGPIPAEAPLAPTPAPVPAPAPERNEPKESPADSAVRNESRERPTPPAPPISGRAAAPEPTSVRQTSEVMVA